jgi:hypothetical protein
MNFTLERDTDAGIEPLTLAEMKLHLRVDAGITTEDAEISALITVARLWIEDFTGRALIDQQWTLRVGEFIERPAIFGAMIVSGVMPQSPAGIGLYRSPVLAVVSAASLDADGVETALAADDYRLAEPKSKWPRIMGLSAGTAYRVTFRAGYADRTGSPTQDASVVPETYKMAMKLYAEAMYDRDPVMMPKLIEAAENIARIERCNVQFA